MWHYKTQWLPPPTCHSVVAEIRNNQLLIFPVVIILRVRANTATEGKILQSSSTVLLFIRRPYLFFFKFFCCCDSLIFSLIFKNSYFFLFWLLLLFIFFTAPFDVYFKKSFICKQNLHDFCNLFNLLGILRQIYQSFFYLFIFCFLQLIHENENYTIYNFTLQHCM